MIRTKHELWLLSSLVGVSLLGLVSGCKPVAEPAPDQTVATEPVAAKPTTPKVEDIAVDRAQLLRALSDAASAAAVGEVDSAVETSLTGRQFILKMPIGCEGESDAATGWIYDSASQRLTLKATPDVALDDVPKSIGATATAQSSTREESAAEPADPSSAGQTRGGETAAPATPLTVESVDGFWIKQPWILSDRCPVIGAGDRAPAADEDQDQEQTARPAAAAPQFAIAQFYTSKDPRTGRRGGQPYRITKKIGEAERPDQSSLRLVLRGRLSPPPGGRLIECTLPSPETPPRCIIAASFDRVSFENADGSIVYGQWGGR